jgi:chromatin segregation and condensation protein Rec8/ScpA/Scc1 (kleisin family)
MRELYATVRRDGRFPLLSHLNTRADIEETVVLFVAALELVRLGGVIAVQRRPFAEIYLRPSSVELNPEVFLRRENEDHGP